MSSCVFPFVIYDKRYQKQSRYTYLNHKYRLTEKVEVPCGRCLNCRISKQRFLVHAGEYEHKKFKYGTFLTLTYDDLHLKDNLFESENGLSATLNYSHVRALIRALRYKFNKDFSYVFSGEYGENPGNGIPRPHYHVCFFGLPFNLDYRNYWKKGVVMSKPLLSGAVRYVLKYLDKFDTSNKKNYTDVGLVPPHFFHSVGFGRGLIFDNLDDVIKNNYTYKFGLRRYPIPAYYRSMLFGIPKPDTSLLVRSLYDNGFKPKGKRFSIAEINKYSKILNEWKFHSNLKKSLDNRSPVDISSFSVGRIDNILTQKVVTSLLCDTEVLF